LFAVPRFSHARTHRAIRGRLQSNPGLFGNLVPLLVLEPLTRWWTASTPARSRPTWSPSP